MSFTVPDGGNDRARPQKIEQKGQERISWLADQSKWIRFPGSRYKGDAQHPDGIIVKDNEPGALGVGQLILKELNICIEQVRLADRDEMSKALGKAIPRSQVEVRMKDQKW